MQGEWTTKALTPTQGAQVVGWAEDHYLTQSFHGAESCLANQVERCLYGHREATLLTNEELCCPFTFKYNFFFHFFR